MATTAFGCGPSLVFAAGPRWAFTVIKVMGTAVTVGMAGVYLLEHFNLLSLQIKETVLGANVFGGLIFGVGFALLAYCPGTNAAALGQGNLDAITSASAWHSVPICLR